MPARNVPMVSMSQEHEVNPLDIYLPSYSFHERHTLAAATAPAALTKVAAAYRPETDPFFRTMIGAREVPMRLANRFRGTKAAAPAAFGLHNFTRLDAGDETHVAYGLVGRFWKADFGLVAVTDSDTFRAFDTPGTARLALGFWTEPADAERVTLVTETRVLCPDAQTYRRFAPYWYLIRPVSGMIRNRILKSIARDAAGSMRIDS